MNITGQELVRYWTTFLAILESEATKYLPPGTVGDLQHLSLLPSRITCYVSTQFGTAVEFESSEATEIHACVGSARVEDLLIRAPRRAQKIGPMFAIGGKGHLMHGLVLDGGFPFRLITQGAELTLSDMRFQIESWTRRLRYAEVYGDRAAEAWTQDKANIRAKEIILGALFESNRAIARKITIREYIAHFKQKTVLLLGDYDKPGMERLNAISDSLVRIGYDPVLIKDVPDHPHHEISAKVIAIGAVARFVVVDDSSKSGHLMEVQLCKNNGYMTILLRENGRGGSWMTAGASHTSKIILEHPYTIPTVDNDIAKAISWAEQKIREISGKFDDTYPWRRADVGRS